MTTTSQRDVAFTPFMLRVREAAAGSQAESTELRFEPSSTCSIAVAVAEWFELRAYAEHMIAEANAMLGADAERIALRDEYGTGVLAFELSCEGQNFRLFVDADAPHHIARIKVGDERWARPEKPVERTVLDDLVVNMLIRTHRPGVDR